jgi:2-isopropylmalate synthase
VPASLFGLKQRIEIGPMSGKSNVIYWLESRKLEATEERVTRIYEHAKQSSAVLEEDEVMQLV